MSEPLPAVSIDPSLCVRCGKCVRDCLARILKMPEDGPPKMLDGGAARCFRCQHCLAICPTGALCWSGKKASDSEPIRSVPEPEVMMNLLRQRRSVRSFREEDAAPETLARLHEAMRFVPTGCNDHRLFFSYGATRRATDSLRRAASESVLAMIAEKSLPPSIAHFAGMKSALLAGADIFFRGAPHFAAIAVPPDAKDAHIDPYIAATQFELLAGCFGLGTCWGGMATDLLSADEKLYERLKLPESVRLKIVLLFGYPAIDYARTPQPAPCGRVDIDGSAS